MQQVKIAAVLAALVLGYLASARLAVAATSSDAIYAAAAPAIAYVDTPIASGSGVLFDEGYLLTDAHVVWPYDRVHVRFPDGTEFRDAPVAAWDLLGDLVAIYVGPVPGVRPLTFADPHDVAVGSEVYLLGYPAERQKEPSPAISRGLLSRFRTGGPADLTFGQTDAATAGGASGGAMLSAAGEVIGIIQLRYPDTSFALALSGSQALVRIRAALHSDPDGLGARSFAAISSGAVTSDVLSLGSVLDERAYVVRSAQRGDVIVRADSSDAVLVVYHASGARIARSATTGPGERSVRFAAESGQPYVVIVGASRPSTVSLRSNIPMLRINDPDDGQVLALGRPLLGNLDFVDDVDVFALDLMKGQSVVITAESTTAEPLLGIASADDPNTSLVDAQASGAGLLGTDARLRFTAPSDGRYLVSMTNAGATDRGAYRLTAYASAPARTAPGAGKITSGKQPAAAPEVVVFGGGTSDDLIAAAACSRVAFRAWAPGPLGQLVPYVPNASVGAVNAPWDELFPFGIPAGTALLVACGSPR